MKCRTFQEWAEERWRRIRLEFTIEVGVDFLEPSLGESGPSAGPVARARTGTAGSALQSPEPSRGTFSDAILCSSWRSSRCSRPGGSRCSSGRSSSISMGSPHSWHTACTGPRRISCTTSALSSSRCAVVKGGGSIFVVSCWFYGARGAGALVMPVVNYWAVRGVCAWEAWSTTQAKPLAKRPESVHISFSMIFVHATIQEKYQYMLT